jgi:hypothetical protein
MRLAIVVLAVGCGRVGFDPLADGGIALGSSEPGACAGNVRVCPIGASTVVPGAVGETDGNTAYYADNVHASCGRGGDIAAAFTFSENMRVAFTVTASFDTALAVLGGADCTAPELACIDNPGNTGEVAMIDGVAGETVVIVADGNGACGPIAITWASLY